MENYERIDELASIEYTDILFDLVQNEIFHGARKKRKKSFIRVFLKGNLVKGIEIWPGAAYNGLKSFVLTTALLHFDP